MNKQGILIVVGVLVLLLVIFIVWTYIFPRISSNTQENNEVVVVATEEEISSAVENLTISESAENVLGETISIDKNRVEAVINENTLWVAPLGGTKNLITISSDSIEFEEGDIVLISGRVQSLSEFAEEMNSWMLTTQDLEILKQNPAVITEARVEIVN